MSRLPGSIIQGIAAPFLSANVDTDVIMPKQFLKGIDRKGLDKGVFYDLRFLEDGQLNPDFVLNKDQYQNTEILIVGENFGCGSSREHAVWGLMQLGIKAIIGTTFAGIFFDNCQRNGLALIQLTDDQIRALGSHIAQSSQPSVSINLEEQTVTSAEQSLSFEIDALRKERLILGLDAIDSTLQFKQDILSFEKAHLSAQPWLA